MNTRPIEEAPAFRVRPALNRPGPARLISQGPAPHRSPDSFPRPPRHPRRPGPLRTVTSTRFHVVRRPDGRIRAVVATELTVRVYPLSLFTGTHHTRFIVLKVSGVQVTTTPRRDGGSISEVTTRVHTYARSRVLRVRERPLPAVEVPLAS